MRFGSLHRLGFCRTPPRARVWSIAAALAALLVTPAQTAEFGTGPWVKGYSDIFAGIIPPVPGFYFRGDAYHYEGFAERTIFNGFAQLGVEQDYTATIAAFTYVSPWKFLGGTYAAAVAPSMVAMDVDVGIGIPQFTGPFGFRTSGPFKTSRRATPISPPATRPSPR